MQLFDVCLYLGVDQEMLKVAMKHPAFPKPTRIIDGEPEFADDDIIVFARRYNVVTDILIDGYEKKSPPRRRRGRARSPL